MNLDNERKAFEGYYIANYHDGDIHPHKKLLEWCEDSESYINSTIDNLWNMWLASANREGYKLVPLQPSTKIMVAIERKVEEQLEASAINADPFRLDGENIYKAMIGDCDE